MDWHALNLGLWILVADWFIRIAALLWIPARTRPAAARSWLLLIGFVPLAGLPLYLLFGHPWLSRTRIARQRQASQVIRDEQRPLADLRWTPPDAGAAAEMAPLLERLGDFMPTHGNAVRLLDDYDASLHALLADIDGARERVHLLYYLMFDDATGEAVVRALERAAARGVTCRVLLDAVGAKRGLRRHAKRLRRAGVDVRAMLPGGLHWRRSGRMDLRNHRKIAVIDDAAAHVGSQNLADADFIAGAPNREPVAHVQGPGAAFPARQAHEHRRRHGAARLEQSRHPLVRAQCRDRPAGLRPRRGRAVGRIEAEYLAHATPVTLADWNRRPQWRRSLEGIARLADSFL